MESFKSCCGVQHAFHHKTLCCYGKQLCIIPRGGKYYSYQNRYTYCYKCFNEIPGDTINLGGGPTDTQIAIKKEEFVEMKNDFLELEPFVTCQACGWKLHQICALHSDSIWPQGFTCDNCLKAKNMKRKDNKFTAKRLPTTHLGTYIETRVNNFLKKKEAGAGEVCIRVVSSSEKKVEVKAGMKRRFVETGELCETFPYKAKALFAFEEIDGIDVCFFGMHVQEYGSDCPTPNTRRVYISYLDSIHFFRPRQFRTAVYHQILLGYLEYVKELGYTMAHIWACPPSEGDDYIFHCHPPEQKVPKPKRLQEWYKKMLDKGIIERIVFDYKDIFKQAMEDNLASAAELPYFDGDFWPNVLEESIKELDQEEEEKRRQAEAAEAAAATSVKEEVEVTEDDKEKGQKKGNQKGKKKGKQKGQKKKSNKAKANQRKNTKKSNIPQTGDDLSTKLFTTMEKHKDVFFVIRLHSAQSAASLGPINDPDPFIQCDLMDGRDDFLTMARDQHYEFSSLRRAKYSSMSMLYELHNQGQDRFVYTCNICKNHVETRYNCTVCDDYDLCVGCYQKTGHLHKMDKLGLDLDDGPSPSPGSKYNRQEAFKLSIQRCIQSLVHACQCRDANCQEPSCQKMKRGIAHAKVCKSENKSCQICKQLTGLCCLHAKYCEEIKCTVPFCANIKQKLQQQEAHHRLQQDQLLRRRMQMMQMMGRGGSAAPSTQTPAIAAPPRPSPTVPQTLGSPMTISGMSMGGGKPANGTLAALQRVKQIQNEVARQHAQAIALNRISVGLHTQPNHQTPPHQQLMRPSGNQATNVGFRGPQSLLNAPVGQQSQVQHPGGMSPARPMQNYMQPQQANMMMQQQQGIQQNLPRPLNQSQPQKGIIMANQQVRPVGPQLGGPVNPGGLGQELLQKLVQTCRSPATPEKQQQVLQILKSNPQLMTAFIQYRQRQQQQNVQQGQAGQPMMSPVMNQQPQQPNFIQHPGGMVTKVAHQQGPQMQQRPQVTSNPQQQQQLLQGPPQLLLGNNGAHPQATRQFLNSESNQFGANEIGGNQSMSHMAGNMNPTMPKQMGNAYLQSRRFDMGPVFSPMGSPTLVSNPRIDSDRAMPTPSLRPPLSQSPHPVGVGSGKRQLDILHSPKLVSNDPSQQKEQLSK